MRWSKLCGIVLFSAVFVSIFAGVSDCQAQAAKKYKVLVVMAYHADYDWMAQEKKGIDPILNDVAELRYFYLDLKKNKEGGPAKAAEAYEIVKEWKPDGIIVSEDDPQKLFVVPYIMGNNLQIPVMFIGVNNPPSDYGYPNKYVSGVREVHVINETLALFLQINPKAKTFGYLAADDSTGKGVESQILIEQSGYPLKYVEGRRPKTLADLEQACKELSKTCDVIFCSTLAGVIGEDGKGLPDDTIPMSKAAQWLTVPLVTNNLERVKFGAICAVAKSGAEHGDLAAKMLLKAMSGTPVSELAVTQNRFGERMINAAAMKRFGYELKPDLLRGTQVMTTEAK